MTSISHEVIFVISKGCTLLGEDAMPRKKKVDDDEEDIDSEDVDDTDFDDEDIDIDDLDDLDDLDPDLDLPPEDEEEADADWRSTEDDE